MTKYRYHVSYMGTGSAISFGDLNITSGHLLREGDCAALRAEVLRKAREEGSVDSVVILSIFRWPDEPTTDCVASDPGCYYHARKEGAAICDRCNAFITRKVDGDPMRSERTVAR